MHAPLYGFPYTGIFIIMRLIFALIFVLTACSVWAQDILTELQKNVPGQGTIVINQSPEVKALVGARNSTSSVDGKTIRTVGYRIQLFAGNNSRVSKDEAYRIAGMARELYPEASVYTIFQSPRWLCQFGDYRTIEEADAMMHRLRETGEFKEMAIVRSQIIIKIEE